MNESTVIKVNARGYADYTYDEEDTWPRFDFGQFGYEKFSQDVADILNRWDLVTEDGRSIKFKEVISDGSYFEEESDEDSGVLDCWVEIEGTDFTESDLQYISETVAMYLADDANIAITGEYVSYRPYWNYNSEDINHDTSVEALDDTSNFKLIKDSPITYTVQ